MNRSGCSQVLGSMSRPTRTSALPSSAVRSLPPGTYQYLTALPPDDEPRIRIKLEFLKELERRDAWIQELLESVLRDVEESSYHCIMELHVVLVFIRGIGVEVDDVCVAGGCVGWEAIELGIEPNRVVQVVV
jgi:hypothetical protein